MSPPTRPAPTDPPTMPGDGAIAGLSYEQARDELVAVVARLEAGGETLEGSLALWERGEALAARCQEWLDGARRRLEAARTTHHTSTGSAAATPTASAATPGTATATATTATGDLAAHASDHSTDDPTDDPTGNPTDDEEPR